MQRQYLTVLIALALTSLGLPAAAQTLRGRVLDAGTDAPVSQVRVEILRADGIVIAHHVTDASGRFVFPLKAAGVYRLRTSHVAFQPLLTREMALGSQEEVAADIRISSVPIELEPLTVVARRQDARNDASAEGMYARYRQFPPIGNRRVFLPHDPEMVNAMDVSDILGWSLPPRGCRIVYWNGLLQGSAQAAAIRLEMPVGMLEAVEYYRSINDAPLAYRDIPGYLAECVSFHVIALWPRTGRYAVEVEPHYAPEPKPWYPRGNIVAYHLRGHGAPGIGGGLELSSHTQISRNVQLGVMVRGTLHQLSSRRTDELTSTLSDVSYVLPPGKRGLQLWALGLDMRVSPVQRPHIRIVTSLRINAAQRRFSLASPAVHASDVDVTSYGLGVGVTGGAEVRIGRRTLASAGIGQDWYRFRAYEEIERPFNPTSATWHATALRLGIIYSFGQN